MESYFGTEEWIKAASYTLRYAIFVLEQEIPAHLEFDGKDAYYPNLVRFHQEQPIATLRYQKLNDAKVQFDRFCVAKDWRKRGIGREMLQTAEKRAKSDAFQEIYLVAEMAAVPFYEKQGYQPFSDPLIEDGILCQQMRKKLHH
ncbi:GNAT family N-acetyltransferase [Enterococcus sp. DIV2381]|uniref:GNAT family N-acetyltransferase n=1 Tax=unclassified Enterococcus TaxID=2608891 RepID=UPI003D2CCF7F